MDSFLLICIIHTSVPAILMESWKTWVSCWEQLAKGFTCSVLQYIVIHTKASNGPLDNII